MSETANYWQHKWVSNNPWADIPWGPSKMHIGIWGCLWTVILLAMRVSSIIFRLVYQMLVLNKNKRFERRCSSWDSFVKVKASWTSHVTVSPSPWKTSCKVLIKIAMDTYEDALSFLQAETGTNDDFIRTLYTARVSHRFICFNFCWRSIGIRWSSAHWDG